MKYVLKIVLVLLLGVLLAGALFSCSQQIAEPVAPKFTQKYYRIVVIDRDSLETVSKIVSL